MSTADDCVQVFEQTAVTVEWESNTPFFQLFLKILSYFRGTEKLMFAYLPQSPVQNRKEF